MIEARGLTKRFGQVVAVDRLAFSVRPGEVTGFLGRNGAAALLGLGIGVHTRSTAGAVSGWEPGPTEYR